MDGRGLRMASMATPVVTSAARAPRSPVTAMGTIMAISTELAMVLMKLSTRGLMRRNDMMNTPPKRVTRVTTAMMAINARTPRVVVSIAMPDLQVIFPALGSGFQPEQSDHTTSQCTHHNVHIGRQPFPRRQRSSTCHQPGHENTRRFLATEGHGQQKAAQYHIQAQCSGVL